MSGLLRGCRILSNEQDASVKQEMKTNINIHVKDGQKKVPAPQDRNPLMPQPYPNLSRNIQEGIPPSAFQSVPASQCQSERGDEYIQYAPQAIHYPTPEELQQVQSRTIDLTAELDDKDAQIQVLEELLTSYENNPVMINKLVICQYQQLITIIKTLTGAEKVELVCDDDANCTCLGSKFIKLSTILVTKNGVATEFKRNYNDKYTLLTKHAISTKLVVEK
jgi:hypothetical protein